MIPLYAVRRVLALYDEKHASFITCPSALSKRKILELIVFFFIPDQVYFLSRESKLEVDRSIP